MTPPIDMPVTAAVRPDPGDLPYAHGPLAFDRFSCRRLKADVAAVMAVEHFDRTPTVTVLER